MKFFVVLSVLSVFTAGAYAHLLAAAGGAIAMPAATEMGCEFLEKIFPKLVDVRDQINALVGGVGE